jgi:hypothetical protein
MGRIEDLAKRYENHISAPWQQGLAGDQKAIFVVYPKEDERRLRARIDLFEIATVKSTHTWKLHDYTDTFAQWMAGEEYRDAYFEEPDTLTMKLRSSFLKFAAEKLQEKLIDDQVDENTVVAVLGVASLFGFAKVSLILKEVASSIRGRLVVFFPGEFENNNYRLLDARDGWNYLAVPITLNNGVGD